MTRALVTLFVLAASVLPAYAQETSRAEIAVSYDWLHANAPANKCGCFSLNGGTAAAAWHVTPRFSIIGEVGAVHASNVRSAGNNLTLTTFLLGPRYAITRRHLTPFAQVLLGGAYASALANPDGGTGNGFAMSAGGGMDLSLIPQLSWRAIQVDYLLTLVPNGINNHQNNLRLGTGVVLRFGGRR